MRRFLATKSPLKMMKNAFYFTSNALFVFKIFRFLSWVFGHVKKRVDWKDKVNFTIFDDTIWSTTIAIHILTNISRVKAIRQWNFTWETFFLKNHTQNVMEELFQDPFIKNYNWAYLWINGLCSPYGKLRSIKLY